ncbi:unnamed protein product [Victoria cruziana]
MRPSLSSSPLCAVPSSSSSSHLLHAFHPPSSGFLESFRGVCSLGFQGSSSPYLVSRGIGVGAKRGQQGLGSSTNHFIRVPPSVGVP